MANRHKGEAGLEVEGVSYTLAFDINAMCEVEYILDQPTDRILASLVRSPPLHIVRALLWGGLRKHHPEVDLHAAGAMMESMGGAGKALDAIGSALTASLPDAVKDDHPDRPQNGAAAGTGRRSRKPG